MHEKLRSFLEHQFPVTDEQFEFIKALFIPKKVSKGDFLLREGEMTRYSIFVASGCLRTYTIDDHGKEHILQFSPENWWTGDMSFTSNVPSRFFIEALEDSEVLLTELSSIQKLNKYIPESAAHYQAALQKSMEAKTQRIISSLSATAEERYNDFLKKYPSLLQRVPQHMIASYLGISPETLSRIRKQQSHKR
ncbi:MAG TPA: Crp/Fnr family transcriptional regulator [Chitinophagaceae bacterium]|nr:Crp/Fnr family transcriptional regulator [Chitinophagaceae bacterium]